MSADRIEWAMRRADYLRERGGDLALAGDGAAILALAAALREARAENERAEREVGLQMASKLEAQMALKHITDALDLKFSELGNGWTEATPKILARIETIVDEADRGFSERDAAQAENERLREELRVIGIHSPDAATRMTARAALAPAGEAKP